MNDIKIKKFIKKLLFLDNIEESDINFKFDKSEKKYKIYHNLSNRMMKDLKFAIQFDEIFDETFKDNEFNDIEIIGNEYKLEILNKQKNKFLFNNIKWNQNNFLLNKNSEISKKNVVKTSELNNSFYTEYGVAS